MKPLLITLILVSLAGCGSNQMTNDAIIAEALKCEQAGLPWRQVFSPNDGTVVAVYCSPHMRPLSRSAL